MNELPTDEREGLPSASPWRRYELCGGSFQLEEEAKRIGQAAHQKNPEAQSGDRKHEWIAGLRPDDQLSETELTTARFLRERGDEQIERIFGDDQHLEFIIEKRFWLNLGGNKALSGRIDRAVTNGRTALLQDWKTGFSEPDPAEDNAQLKVLAVLFALNYQSVEEVICQIISGPYGVTEVRFSIGQLSSIYEGIIETLRRINSPNAPFNPSPEACRYCPAILICQAIKDVIGSVAKEQYSALPLEPERAGKLLDEVALVRNHLDQIEKFYYEKLSADPAYRITGYGLVPGNVVRSVSDWHAARGRLEEFLDPGDLDAAETYTLGDLEAALARKLKLKAKAAKVKINKILNGLIIEKQNRASLQKTKKEIANA